MARLGLGTNLVLSLLMHCEDDLRVDRRTSRVLAASGWLPDRRGEAAPAAEAEAQRAEVEGRDGGVADDQHVAGFESCEGLRARDQPLADEDRVAALAEIDVQDFHLGMPDTA